MPILSVYISANFPFAFGSAEIERHEDYFTNLVKQLLSSYEVLILLFVLFIEMTCQISFFNICAVCKLYYHLLPSHFDAERVETTYWSHRKVCGEFKEPDWWVFPCIIFTKDGKFPSLATSLIFSKTADSSALSPGSEIDDSQLVNPRRNLEEEYLDYEAKVNKHFISFRFIILMISLNCFKVTLTIYRSFLYQYPQIYLCWPIYSLRFSFSLKVTPSKYHVIEFLRNLYLSQKSRSIGDWVI